MKLLIIEDEKDLIIPVKRFLEKNNLVVDTALDGIKALDLIRTSHYDCVLLDLNLPEIDGLTIAKKMREESNETPIIMVTARSQVYDKLEGFDSGADDYVTKPFELKELLARIRAVIKRSSLNKSKMLEVGNVKLYPDSNRALVGNKKFELSNKETAIFEYLIRNKGKIVSTEELLEHVWDSEIDFFTDTVKTHIKTLRKKIDPQKNIIKTVKGKGYIVS